MEKKADKPWLPPTLAALGVWGVWAFLPKMALQTLPPHNVIFYESIGNFIVTIPVLIWLKFKLSGDRRTVSFIAMTSVLTVCAILSYFTALSKGPVAVIATMTAMYPVISLILARVILKERVNKRQMVAIAMAVCSILLLAMP